MLASSKHVELANFIALSVLCVCNIYIFVKLVVVLRHNYDVCNQSNWHHFFLKLFRVADGGTVQTCLKQKLKAGAYLHLHLVSVLIT